MLGSVVPYTLTPTPQTHDYSGRIPWRGHGKGAMSFSQGFRRAGVGLRHLGFTQKMQN